MKTKRNSAGWVFGGLWVLFFYLPLAQAGLKVGEKAPDFSLPSLSGETISLSQFQGKVVVLHLWKCQ